jgi:hypothetical protein
MAREQEPLVRRYRCMAIPETRPDDTHPLAPEVETPEERAENSTEAVNVRAGVEIGAMRYVLWIGLALAVVVMAAAYFLG